MTTVQFLSIAGFMTLVSNPAANQVRLEPTGSASNRAAVCAPADDFAAKFLSHIQRLVTSADTGDVATRQRLQWPSVNARSVTYVTDNAVCSAAEAAYTPAVPLTPPAAPSGQVYVFNIGTVYFIFDRAQSAGEWTIAMTLDRKFNVLVKTKV